MKKLSNTLICKIESWLKPLPEQLQVSVWNALRESEKAGVFFNRHASDFRELFVWRHTPAGDYFWEFVTNTTAFFQEQGGKEKTGRSEKIYSARHTYMQSHAKAQAAA